MLVKISTIYLSTSIALTALTSVSAHAIDLGSLANSSSEEIKKVATDQLSSFKTSEMIGYAAKQLNLSDSTVSASLGSLLKVAKDNLNQDNFALITKAIPDAQAYVDKAPKVSTSSVTSMFSSTGSAGKKAESAEYLSAAFKKLGLSTEQVPSLLNSFSGYLEKSGYGDAAEKLKQGLSFL